MAFEANADQSLALISRGSTGAYDQAFRTATGRLVDRPLTDEMADAAGLWRFDHDRKRT